jgi:hypothetical protein
MGNTLVPDPLANVESWSGWWTSSEISIQISVSSPDVLSVSIADKGVSGGAADRGVLLLNVPPLNVNNELADVNKFKVGFRGAKSEIVLNTIQVASGAVTLTLVKSPEVQVGGPADRIQYHRHLLGPFFATHVISRQVA